jgi:hypothetical protein
LSASSAATSTATTSRLEQTLAHRCLAEHPFLSGVDDGVDAAPRLCRAIDVAEALSINPQQLGPQTPMCGHGLLALTSHGVAHGVAPGALRI